MVNRETSGSSTSEGLGLRSGRKVQATVPTSKSTGKKKSSSKKQSKSSNIVNNKIPIEFPNSP